MKMNVQRIVIA